MNLSARMSNFELSATIKIADHVAELERMGEKILNLSTGAPHFPTPPSIVTATMQALRENKTGYSDSRGIYQLRKRLCDYYNEQFGTNLKPEENILITPGGKQAILYCMLSLLEPGDEVLIPSPAWVSFAEIVKIAGGIPVTVDCNSENDFEFSLEQIQKVVTKKTKALIINSPCNPTGKIIKSNLLNDIHQFCKKNNIFVFSDEIYDKIVFSGYEHSSLLQVDQTLQNSVILNGFSKTYAMTGWRLGYIIGPSELIDGMVKLQQNSVTCPTTFIQFGVLNGFDECKSFPQHALNSYQENRDFLLKEFESLKNFRLIKPEGAFYGFIDVSKLSTDSVDFCFQLLNTCKVAAVPGVAFGNSGEGFIRISFATSKDALAEFVRRIRAIWG